MARSLCSSERRKKYICKTQQRFLSPEITTLLLKIIHWHCREQFLLGTYSSFDLLSWPVTLASSVSFAGSLVFHPPARRYGKRRRCWVLSEEIFWRFERQKLRGHLAPLCSREALTAPWPASPKPVSSHQNNLDGYAANGEMYFLNSGWTVPYVSPPEGE